MTDATYSRLTDPRWTRYLRDWHARKFPRSRLPDVEPEARPMRPKSPPIDPPSPVLSMRPAPYAPLTWQDRQFPKLVHSSQIIAASAALARCSVEELIGPRRAKHLAVHRHAAIYVTVKHIGRLSLPQIGQIFGGRDHSTIIHARNKVKADLEADGSVFGDIVPRIEQALGLGDVDNVDNPVGNIIQVGTDQPKSP